MVQTPKGPAMVRVEVNHWIIGGNTRVEKLPLPQDGTVVAQVRGGELTAIIAGRREPRKEGAIFTVPRGAALGVETEDDSAILETVVVVPWRE